MTRFSSNNIHFCSSNVSSSLQVRGQSRRPPWISSRKKDYEKNFLAAFFYMITVALLCMSLAHLRWFHVSSLVCSHHIGAYQFLSIGYFDTNLVDKDRAQIILDQKDLKATGLINTDNELPPGGSSWVAQFHTFGQVLVCITPSIAVAMRVLLCFCLFAILSALSGFFIDIIGPKKSILQRLRVNAVPGVLTVLCCIVMIALCSYVTVLLQNEADASSNGKTYVSYDYGFYVITAAGTLALIATACDVIRFRLPRRMVRRRSMQRVRLMDDWDNEDAVYRDLTCPSHLPPPPPYSP